MLSTHLEQVRGILKKNNIRSIQSVNEKCKVLIDKSRPQLNFPDETYSEVDIAYFDDKTYTELKKDIEKLKVQIDVMSEAMARKNPTTIGLKKTIKALNTVQSKINEEMAL